MVNFSDIPTEIWLLIAKWIPMPNHFVLKTLNSFFFDYWMNIQWSTISVHTSREFKSLLQRALDPFVVRRVKRLMIGIDSDTSRNLPFLLSSLTQFPNISALEIDVIDDASLLVRIFRGIMLCPMASTLKRIFLRGCVKPLSSLAECIPQQVFFKGLTELELHLVDNQRLDAHGHIVINTSPCSSNRVAPFLLLLAPTLCTLRISTSVDLAPLFDALNQSRPSSPSNSSIPFPNLKFLGLDFFPFRVSMQSSPGSLRLFLLAHNKRLKRLGLVVNFRSGHADESLDAWFAEFTNSNYPFPSLQSLEIYQRPCFPTLLTLLKRTGPTLLSLEIGHGQLEIEEIEEALALLTAPTKEEESPKLKKLYMDVVFLTVPILDLLSRKLPQLESLDLSVTRAVGSGQNSLEDLLLQRRFDPDVASTQDSLHAWKLQDINIRWANWGHKAVMRAIASTVPTLASKFL